MNMLKKLGTAVFVAGVAMLPCVAIAQSSDDTQSTESDQPAADAQEAADGVSTNGLSMGAPEGGETGVGETYVAEVFTDWEMRCVRTEDGNDPCQLYQLLRDGEGNSVAEFSLFNLPEGSGQAVGGATVVTPLETLLTAPLRLTVDSGEGRRYPYSFCSRVGCFARLGFTQGEIDGFKRGASATVSIVPAAAPNETVDLSLSLSGFTAGWNAVIEANSDNAQ